ncbi:MAG: lysophospholipid acyltransferase family protein [Opitutales bacterium]
MPDAEPQTSPTDSSLTPRPRQVRALTGWRKGLMVLLGWVLRLWNRTLRYELSPEDRARIGNRSQPTLHILWHNRLFNVADAVHRYRAGQPTYALISASSDGAWLTAFFEQLGLRAVRGSRNFRGSAALREAVRVLQGGNDLGITPDGSRGPVYVVKPGAVAIARLAKCPILLHQYDYAHAIRLKSWDRFFIPLPFSKVTARYRRFENLDALPADDRSIDALAAQIGEELQAMGGQH